MIYGLEAVNIIR